jgi:hypothetical protein
MSARWILAALALLLGLSLLVTAIPEAGFGVALIIGGPWIASALWLLVKGWKPPWPK